VVDIPGFRRHIKPYGFKSITERRPFMSAKSTLEITTPNDFEILMTRDSTPGANSYSEPTPIPS
jgi:hypothetical protein